MARPFVPDALKKRSIPLRLGKPAYRALSAHATIRETSIQELVRRAVETELARLRQEVDRSPDLDFPTELQLGQMSDTAFTDWIHRQKRPGAPAVEEPDEEQEPSPGPRRTRMTRSAA